MKAAPASKRGRFARMYGWLAVASISTVVAGATLTPPDANPWILPIAGLIGCVLCSAQAFRLRHGHSFSRHARSVLRASVPALAATVRERLQRRGSPVEARVHLAKKGNQECSCRE